MKQLLNEFFNVDPGISKYSSECPQWEVAPCVYGNCDPSVVNASFHLNMTALLPLLYIAGTL
jgi:hypothetical protein